jgi:putative heme degradation protein
MERIEQVKWKLLYILERASNKAWERVVEQLTIDNQRLEAELSYYVSLVINRTKPQVH